MFYGLIVPFKSENTTYYDEKTKIIDFDEVIIYRFILVPSIHDLVYQLATITPAEGSCTTTL